MPSTTASEVILLAISTAPGDTETADFHALIMRETGHNMYMERPDAVARAVETFANGHSLPSSI